MNTILQYPCSYPGCRRFFKTLGGHKKHIRSAHPILSPPRVPSPPASPRISSHSSCSPSLPPTQVHAEQQPDQDGWDGEDFGPPPYSLPPDHHDPQEPVPPDENTQFFGPGDKYYRCYHPKLTGQKLPLSQLYI